MYRLPIPSCQKKTTGEVDDQLIASRPSSIIELCLSNFIKTYQTPPHHVPYQLYRLDHEFHEKAYTKHHTFVPFSETTGIDNRLSFLNDKQCGAADALPLKGSRYYMKIDEKYGQEVDENKT